MELESPKRAARKQNPQWTKWSTVNIEPKQFHPHQTSPSPIFSCPSPLPRDIFQQWRNDSKIKKKKKKKEKWKGGFDRTCPYCTLLLFNTAASKLIPSNSGNPIALRKRGSNPRYEGRYKTMLLMLSSGTGPEVFCLVFCSRPGSSFRFPYQPWFLARWLLGKGMRLLGSPQKYCPLLESVGQDFTPLANEFHVHVCGRCLV